MDDIKWLSELENIKLESKQFSQEFPCSTGELKQLLKTANDDNFDIETRIKYANKYYKNLLDEYNNINLIEPSDAYNITKNVNYVTYKLDECKNIEDKIKGAWIGRIIGCTLGQPVESWTHHKIQEFAMATNNFPIANYFSSDIDTTLKNTFNIKDAPGPYGADKVNWINNIDCAPADDDMNYSVLALKTLLNNNNQVDTKLIGLAWIGNLPFLSTCTAERLAYANFIKGIKLNDCAVINNPYREWIGGQIRVDAYGYTALGDPQKAILNTIEDLSLSHVKNGIYGGIIIASMISIAPFKNNFLEITEEALNYIPSESRLYNEIGNLLALYKGGKDYDFVSEYIHANWDECDEFDWCHTIPNCLIVIASLLYCNNDFDLLMHNSIAIGFDTDCNGASAGSIFGCHFGTSKIGKKWIKPLNNKLKTNIIGYEIAPIDRLVSETIVCLKSK